MTMPKFKNIFSIPREPNTMLSPGNNFELKVPKGKKVLITDIYVENLGPGTSIFSILEQRQPNSFEVRYTFRTEAKQTLVINFTTGLKLGDEAPIANTIRITTDGANAMPRVNGFFV
jgi:hypothetical protein